MNSMLQHPGPDTGQDERTLSQVRISEASHPELPASRPAVVALPRVKPGQPAADLIQAALRGAMSRIAAADREARRGEVEGIHRLRTSTRRLRSELHTVRDLVERDWREHLEQELKWLAGKLGSVRDLDILCHRLRSAGELEPGQNGVGDRSSKAPQKGDLEPFLAELRERHARNSRALREALQGERYRNLLSALEGSIADPALKEEAWESCRTALPPLAEAAWRRLKSGGRELEPDAPDADFHEVRKSAKRARYTAELIAPALGRRAGEEAKRFIALTTQLQDVLGEHQDAIIATAEIERFLAEHPQEDDSARAARHLLEAQRHTAQATRADFFAVWKKLDRKKSLRWFKNRKYVKA